ncbi:copper amine oxidase N-terminal domain-containing protein [Paenibacillus radicis (ex Xue et al. 2023)]|uniref:Copper amine oxidase N-terminal domain-containing protein n=1 Tax=Paenibacillus radicis (ex Xue et al. 2023) TaxID=2972489 RepID=A0ABT1YKW1_9BACL|nr:copper amine oxidase N-terminal domain-containing protein [Paenibacillus radicis (ex Xue et al. 2023)]MCR8633832.1 copper amine oxidase N-terminal domain-containing protein [Paenibacillus radicis (ex Xue et al. 2023)]
MHGIKKIRLASITLIFSMLIAIIPAQVSAQETSKIHVYIQQELQQWDPSPFIKDGSTMVPMRALFEKLGFLVTWDADKQTAKAVRGGLSISLSINRGTAMVNETVYYLDVTPSLENGSTFIPLRFVSEAAGADVAWNESNRSVQVQFETDPQKRIHRLIDNVTHSGSFIQAAMSITSGDGIKNNGIIVKEITMDASGATAKVKFTADITVSKAVKNDRGVTISPVESVVYEITCDVYKDAFDQWLLQTEPSKMNYVLREKKPFMNTQ